MHQAVIKPLVLSSLFWLANSYEAFAQTPATTEPLVEQASVEPADATENPTPTQTDTVVPVENTTLLCQTSWKVQQNQT